MTSSAPTAELKAALDAFFDAVSRQKTETPPPPLLPHFEIIDRWHATHRGEIPPLLNHFLEGKSYQKALFFLEGKPVEG